MKTLRNAFYILTLVVFVIGCRNNEIRQNSMQTKTK